MALNNSVFIRPGKNLTGLKDLNYWQLNRYKVLSSCLQTKRQIIALLCGALNLLNRLPEQTLERKKQEYLLDLRSVKTHWRGCLQMGKVRCSFFWTGGLERFQEVKDWRFSRRALAVRIVADTTIIYMRTWVRITVLQTKRQPGLFGPRIFTKAVIAQVKRWPCAVLWNPLAWTNMNTLDSTFFY